MQVTEIFRSIQGESTYAGEPCIFVRLTGCNLRCVWCDTAYAFYGGKPMSVEEVAEAVRQFSDLNGARCVGLVEITGGEPLLQKEVVPLMERLIADDYRVMVETSGERYIGNLPPAVIRIVDVKCPGSGEGGTFCMENLKVLTRADELKFVIVDRADYEWSRAFLREHSLAGKVGKVIFSPAFGTLPPQTLTEWILEDGLPVRLGLQLHKFIWHPERQGV
jgi:7-carboxy-7-deazaguanine synthase